MAELGKVERLGFDKDNYERCRRLEAVAECPRCGSQVECWSETEEWHETHYGKWIHSQYGGAQGICEACHVLIADCLGDGFRCFDLAISEKRR